MGVVACAQHTANKANNIEKSQYTTVLQQEELRSSSSVASYLLVGYRVTSEGSHTFVRR